MGWQEWLKFEKKAGKEQIHSSQDFRKEAKKSEPNIPYITEPIAFPFLGPVRAYYVSLFALFAFFIITKNAMLGLAAGINIIFIVLWEFYAGSKTGGVKNEVRDTAIAIAIGLFIWFGFGFLLNTPTPINAIVSCSMLPEYERGDMIILQGGEPKTQVLQYSGKLEDITSEAKVYHNGEIALEANGSMYSYCSQNADELCIKFVSSPQEFYETHGPIRLDYGFCTKYYINEKKSIQQVCVKKTYFEGKEIAFDKGYELVVQQPKEGDIYSLVGDIVHRVRFAVNASDGTAYFTKGDNNAIYDFQIYSKQYGMGNSPILPSQLKGRAVLRIPLLGNFKLFIAPQVLFADEDSTGCGAYFKD